MSCSQAASLPAVTEAVLLMGNWSWMLQIYAGTISTGTQAKAVTCSRKTCEHKRLYDKLPGIVMPHRACTTQVSRALSLHLLTGWPKVGG